MSDDRRLNFDNKNSPGWTGPSNQCVPQINEVHVIGIQSLIGALSDIAFALNRVAHSVQQMEDTLADFRAMAAKEMGR